MGPGVLTRPFPRIDGVLHAGRHRLDDLAERFGTPLYVYDLDAVERAYRRFLHAFEGVPLDVAYSVKANGSLAVLRRLADLGAGADIVSEGELFRALRAGIRTILIPTGNRKDIPDLPKEVREKLEIVPVETVDEVLSHALTDPA